jgi:hypothetical protein
MNCHCKEFVPVKKVEQFYYVKKHALVAREHCGREIKSGQAG